MAWRRFVPPSLRRPFAPSAVYDALTRYFGMAPPERRTIRPFLFPYTTSRGVGRGLSVRFDRGKLDYCPKISYTAPFVSETTKTFPLGPVWMSVPTPKFRPISRLSLSVISHL